MGTRRRHRGDRRNPWDEFECGHHYSRSMASYGLLTALSGFSVNAAEGRIGFAPRVSEKDFRVFFSIGSGWGAFAQRLSAREKRFTIELKQGTLRLKTLDVAPGGRTPTTCAARRDGRKVEARIDAADGGARVTFARAVTLRAGQRLDIRLGK